METELMPQCGVCGTRGTHRVGAETAAPAVGCHCGVIVTGFTEVEATERWNLLARRAEIGRLVEAICCSDRLDGPLKIFPPGFSETFRATLVSYAQGHLRTESASLLDALRKLEKEVCGE